MLTKYEVALILAAIEMLAETQIKIPASCPVESWEALMNKVKTLVIHD